MGKYKQIVIIKTPGCVGWCIETKTKNKKNIHINKYKIQICTKSAHYKVQRNVS